MTKGIAYPLLLAFACWADWAGAQTIDAMEWVQSGQDRVLRIGFTANVHYLRQTPQADSITDLAQLSFQIVAADESVLAQVVEEGKHLDAGVDTPNVDLTYVPQPAFSPKIVTLRLGSKVQVQARQGRDGRSIEVILLHADSSLALPAMVESVADRHFMLQLQSPQDSSALPRLPSQLQDYALFTRPTAGSKVGDNDLMLGYFKTEQDAQTVLAQVRKRFADARVLPWEAPAQTPVPGPAPVPLPAAAAAEMAAGSAPGTTAAEVVAQGKALLSEGQQALQENRFQDAVDRFNQALMLPPNPASQATQELIGQAWEGLNKPDKARLEYQLYLKLYPQGPDAERVALRLAQLPPPLPVAAASPAAGPAKSRYSATGSISQYYYGGNTKTESLVNIASGVDQNTLSLTTQSVLVSSWDASAKYEGDGEQTKLVMRGSHSDNLADSSTLTTATQGLISAAYMDYHHDASGLSLRAGRQSAIGGAMFGLFDGVSASLPFGQGYKADAMFGVPANTLINAPQQVLMGAMIEADNLFPHWGGNVSLVQQNTEGIVDRQAVGLDTRYFGDTVSMYSQIDYDINLNVLNAVTLQGSMQGPWDSTVTLMLDDRKAPTLQVSDALIGSNFMSLAQMVAAQGLASVQSAALGTAAEAKQAMLSVSRALAPKWQGSMDLRYSEVSALPAIGNFQATPATGAQYNVSVQLTGSNLYSARDINGFNLSYLSSDLMQGTQIAYNNLTGIWGSAGSIEPSIRYYTQTDNTDTRLVRISPGLRLSYKLSPRASVMGESIYELSQTDGPTNHETSSSVYFYVGYRYDFQ